MSTDFLNTTICVLLAAISTSYTLFPLISEGLQITDYLNSSFLTRLL